METRRIAKSEGFFWLAMGVFICLAATRTGIGPFREPGPGFIAFASGLFTAVVGIVMIFTGLLKTVSGRGLVHTLPRVSWPRVLWTLGLLFVYAFFLDRLGHLLATFLAMAGLFYDWDRKNWLMSLILSVLVTAISYVFFEKLLLVRFPGGIWP